MPARHADEGNEVQAHSREHVPWYVDAASLVLPLDCNNDKVLSAVPDTLVHSEVIQTVLNAVGISCEY